MGQSCTNRCSALRLCVNWIISLSRIGRGDKELGTIGVAQGLCGVDSENSL